MTKKNPLIIGTLTLTTAGLITRVIGFFNRIYLSQLIGAEEMGIYQLIFPVYMISFSLCCHGVELALSQMTAEFFAKKKNSVIRPLIFIAAFLSMSLASVFAGLIYYYADYISLTFLKEESCAICLKLMAPILPFTALRCCLHGYYIGLKKTTVPAAGQLVEQIVRVLSIWIISTWSMSSASIFQGASLAVVGMIAGELVGTLFTFLCYKLETAKAKKEKTNHISLGLDLLKRAIPLTGNKLSLTLVSSLESVLIPFMLTRFYKDKSLALSMYGVLTGMALPFIMFPSTITNSLSVMLLPAISEANAKNNIAQIRHTIKKTVKLCLTLGFTALLFFFFFGRQLGTFVFHNESAGDFLFILSFLCPFLYLSSSCASILNGLNFLKNAFFYNLLALLTRILFILFAVPHMGIQGYLVGLLAAYCILVFFQFYKIYHTI